MRGNNSVSTSESFVVKIYNDVYSIPADLLSVLNKRSLLTSGKYYKSVGEANIPGLSFKYVFLYEDKKLKGFCYFQVINLAAKELGTIIHLDPYSKTLNHFSGVINAILFGSKKDRPHYLLIAGNMLVSGDYGLINIDETDFVYERINEVIKIITADLEKDAKVVSTIVKDFKTENILVRKSLTSKSFSKMVMDPLMKMEIQKEWKSFPDYLESLSAKYRLRYHNAKKKIDSLIIKDLSSEEIFSHKEVIEVLYKAVQHKSPVQLIKSDFNYIYALSKNLNSAFNFRAYFDADKMVAFQCGILSNDHYEAHHIGIDYHYNKSHSIYLNLLYEFIRLAIERSAKVISFGRTALEMKTTVGAVPEDYNAFIKLNNYMLNCLVRSFIPSRPSTDWTPRNPFKQEK